MCTGQILKASPLGAFGAAKALSKISPQLGVVKSVLKKRKPSGVAPIDTVI